jgi:hypothetical protein
VTATGRDRALLRAQHLFAFGLGELNIAGRLIEGAAAVRRGGRQADDS